MKTKNVTYIIGDQYILKTSNAAPHVGRHGWCHRARPAILFFDEGGFLVGLRDEARLRIADDKMLADLATVDAEIAAAEEAARALRAKRQQILRDGVDRCPMVPAPGGKTNYDFESDEA